MTFLLAALLLGETFPTSMTARQGKSLDGGFSAWAVECVSGCSSSPGAVAASVNVTDAGVLNVNPVGIAGQVGVNIVDAGAPLNVQGAFFQAVQPISGPVSVNVLDAGPPLNVNPVAVSQLPIAFVQDAGVLNVNPLGIVGQVGVNIVDAGAPLNINLPATAATAAKQDTGNTSLANLDVLLSTRTKPADQQHVIVDTVTPTVTVQGTVTASGPLTDTQLRASAVPISAAALPLPSGAATDSTLSQLLDGGVLQLGRQTDGTVRPVAVDVSGAQLVVMPRQAPLNPFLPRCNPVRRTGCQP